MEEQIKQIGERLRGLRDVLDISTEEMAEVCGISVAHYEQMENGESELSVANLQKIAKHYGVSLDVLMFGEEPKMSSYFLTRKGQGMSVERRSAYNYESLASGFRGRKADPFIVTVEPKPADTPKEMNSQWPRIQYGARRHYGTHHRQQGAHPQRGRLHLLRCHTAPRHEDPQRPAREVPGDYFLRKLYFPGKTGISGKPE